MILFIVYGIPGSGKTKLCNSLKTSIKNCVYLETDILEFYLRKNSITFSQIQKILQTKFSLEEQKVICFEEILNEIDQNFVEKIENKSNFNQIIWETSREIYFEIVKLFVEKKRKNIICEDNFLMKSSRKSFKKLAEQNYYDYCEIFCDTDLEKAVQNNNLRESNRKIPEEVILKSFNLLEKGKKSICFNVFNGKIDDLLTNIDKKIKEHQEKQFMKQKNGENELKNKDNFIKKMDLITRQIINELNSGNQMKIENPEIAYLRDLILKNRNLTNKQLAYYKMEFLDLCRKEKRNELKNEDEIFTYIIEFLYNCFKANEKN